MKAIEIPAGPVWLQAEHDWKGLLRHSLNRPPQHGKCPCSQGKLGNWETYENYLYIHIYIYMCVCMRYTCICILVCVLGVAQFFDTVCMPNWLSNYDTATASYPSPNDVDAVALNGSDLHLTSTCPKCRFGDEHEPDTPNIHLCFWVFLCFSRAKPSLGAWVLFPSLNLGSSPKWQSWSLR